MNFSDLYQSLYDTVLSQLTYFNLAAVFAFFAAMFSAMTYYMRTMVPLRIMGIVANLFYIAMVTSIGEARTTTRTRNLADRGHEPAFIETKIRHLCCPEHLATGLTGKFVPR